MVGKTWENKENPCELLESFNSHFPRNVTKVVNFEAPVTGRPPRKLNFYKFDTDQKFLPCLAETFDLLSLANNHILDQVKIGAETSNATYTIDNLEKFNIPYLGFGKTREKAWSHFMLEDKVALIAVSFTCWNNNNVVDCEEVPRITDDIFYIRSEIKRIKEKSPSASIGLLGHVGLEYMPYTFDYQRQIV